MKQIQACPECGAVRYEGGEHLDTNQAECDPAVAAHYTNVAVYAGFTRRQLNDAFNLVKDRKNWKYPVNALVPRDVDRNLIASAVIFYTGSVPTFTREGRKLRVRAAGYYNAIGS